MQINERQVALRAGGNFSSLNDFLDRRVVKSKFWSSTQILYGLNNSQVALLDASMVGSKPIAIGAQTSVKEEAILAVKLTTPFDSDVRESVLYATDSLNRILNLVEVRNATSQDPILVNGQKVYGLIQADTTVSDGDLVASATTKNLQISFVTFFLSDNNNLFQNVPVSGDIQFTLNLCTPLRYSAPIEFEGLQSVEDLVQPNSYEFKVLQSRLEVVSFVPGGQEISLAGGSPGISVLDNDPTMSLGNSLAEFYNDTTISFLINGIEIDKKGDFIDWISATAFNLSMDLDSGDLIFIKKISFGAIAPGIVGGGY
jgi:hypothetical protein